MLEVPSNLQDMVTKYALYLEETLIGKIDETTQFWMTYAKVVGLIQLMQRAVEINNTLNNTLLIYKQVISIYKSF